MSIFRPTESSPFFLFIYIYIIVNIVYIVSFYNFFFNVSKSELEVRSDGIRPCSGEVF